MSTIDIANELSFAVRPADVMTILFAVLPWITCPLAMTGMWQALPGLSPDVFGR